MTATATTTHELRLIDTNGYTVPGGVRYTVPADQVEAVTAELKDLAIADAASQKATLLEHARLLTGTSAANQRAAATQIIASDYQVKVTPPVA
ncbi:hypothetical protein ACF1AE_21490 [Streptomyces sp. NPDC014986]|uniref:hypothetical protein n=1 Tax=Streptomyces sp. NPDC014986 TaxID=3364934 RepID=UPI0036FE912A